MNTLIIVKIKNTTYDEWKKKFDADAEVQSQMMRNTIAVSYTHLTLPTT